MSEKSFAVASVSVAIVWGTFFYPPMPQKASRTDVAAPVSADVSVERLRADKGSLLPAAPQLRPAALKTGLPAPLRNDCAFAGATPLPGCAPLQKLAGD